MPILLILILVAAFISWLILASLYGRPLGHIVYLFKEFCHEFGNFVEGKESEENHGK